MPDGAYCAPMARTCFHLARGGVDAVLEWAAKVVDQRDPIFFQSTIRPFQTVLNRSPRWPALLQKLNLMQ